jgi:cholesterol transport system auxiliary component
MNECSRIMNPLSSSIANLWRRSRAPRAIRQTVLLAILCSLCGCLSRPHVSTQTFVFEIPLAPASRGSSNSQRIISIRSCRVASPFDDRSLVYRTAEFSYESDPYAEFLVSPSESLIFPIRSWMSQTGSFEAVVEPGSALKPNTTVEITVLELYGDFRRSQDPAALLKLRFVLFDAPGGIPANAVLEREYSRRIRLKARNANALMSGWNEALKQILVQFDGDLQALRPVPATASLSGRS